MMSAGAPSTIDADAHALSVLVERAEEALARLPPKAARDDAELTIAASIHAETRGERARFMQRHAGGLYARLTNGGAEPLRFTELAFRAAEVVPGLVPTREMIAAERRNVQAHKEGREIDQGIFFRGLLRARCASDVAGAMLKPSARAIASLDEWRARGKLDLGAVTIERIGRAAHVTIRNLHCLNAEDDRLTLDLEVAVDLALLDPDIHVGVVRGAPMTHPRYVGRRVFSAGINLRSLHGGQISFVDFLLGRECGYIRKIQRGLAADVARDLLGEGPLQKPWLAVVDTFAIGGGMQLLFAFDHVIAEESAYFSLPAAQEGIVPGAGNLRLGRFAGARLARRIILGGRKIAARDPEATLLCDEVVGPAELDDAVLRAIDALDNPAVVANRRMLQLAEESDASFLAYMAEFAQVQSMRMYAADVLEKIGRAWARREA